VILVPAIDLRGGRCVRLLQGAYDRETVYDGDPVALARGYAEAGAAWLHLVDLDAARDGGKGNRAAIARVVRALPVPCEVGGGIRSEEDVAEVLGLGAACVVVGTLAAERPEVLPRLAARFGERVVLGLDARGGEVRVRGWLEGSGRRVSDLARAAAEAGLRRAVYTDITRDGMLVGPDVEGAAAIQRDTGLRVTASGGVGTLGHIGAAARAGLDACIVGRALLDGRFTLADALAAAREG